MVPYTAGRPTHLGSVLVTVHKGRAAAPTTLDPLAFEPPSNRDANYIECRKLNTGLKLRVVCAAGHTLVDNNLERESKPKIFTVPANFVASLEDTAGLKGFSRDIMLLFPTLLLPGWFGIPQTVRVERASLANMNIAPPDQVTEHSLRLLGGIYATAAGAQYASEFIDDVSPWQATLFKGDDCDGSSISAFNLYLSLCASDAAYTNRIGTPMIVSGNAYLADGKFGIGSKHLVGHSWVMLYTPATGNFVMCETTASTADDSHFSTAAFAWTTDACYAFLRRDGGKTYLGIEVQTVLGNPLPTLATLPSADTSAFLYRVPTDTASPTNLFENTHWFYDAPGTQTLSAFLPPTFVDHGGRLPGSAPAVDSSVLRHGR
jgi:hypothetical protein